MRIVIDIPEEQYTTLNAKTQSEITCIIDHGLFTKAIANGTPLPKGHGRLIDADELFEDVGKIRPQNKVQYKEIGRFLNMITYSPTIIGADKGDI